MDRKRTLQVQSHLEEDAGRLQHMEHETRVDYNRAGVPLMELVTEPDIRSAADAKRFAEELRLLLRYVNASDADMEKGQMRVEVNISLAKEGSEQSLCTSAARGSKCTI